MSFETSTQHFDVIGPGYIPEHHADETRRYLLDSDKNLVGGAMAWLAFYAIAAVVVVVGNFDNTANFIVAAVN